MEEYRPLAEIIIHRPHPMNNYTYVWEVYLPTVQGMPSVASGTGMDTEDAWAKAVRARESYKLYGITM